MIYSTHYCSSLLIMTHYLLGTVYWLVYILFDIVKLVLVLNMQTCLKLHVK